MAASTRPYSGDDSYVTRTMKCAPDKLTKLCHMHLAFLLDLNGDKLEQLLSSEEEQKKKLLGLVPSGIFKKKEKSQPGLFGQPLTDEGVCLMIPLIKFLSAERNMSKEGLFRKAGNSNRMMALRELLVTYGPGSNIDPEIYFPHDVACILKEFLRELPEPLLMERYMEAHRQVSCLGQNAKSPQEVAQYACKKLSALQLLMLLLPAPAQALVMNLLTLLHKIAVCPATKMTSSTLGTIFAPIFFIDRKLEADDLYREVQLTAPAAPKELVADLAKYWNDVEREKSSPSSGSEGEINTNICYVDHKLSQCDDVAGNTQAELASLIAHVQSLPSTPRNDRLKKQIKITASPAVSNKKRSRSKSLRASVKKRLSSLGRSKHSHSKPSTSSASSTKATVSANSELLLKSESPDMKTSHRLSRPKHKKYYTGKNSGTAVSHACSQPQQESKEKKFCVAGTCSDESRKSLRRSRSSSRTDIENREPSTPVSNTRLLGHTETVTPVWLPRTDPSSPPSVTDLCNQSETSVSYSPHQTPKQTYIPRASSSDRKLETLVSYSPNQTPEQTNILRDSSSDRKSETLVNYSPHRTPEQTYIPRASSSDRKLETLVSYSPNQTPEQTNILRDSSSDRKSETLVNYSPHRTPEQTNIPRDSSSDGKSMHGTHPQQRRRQGTPIMPRAVIQAMEDSDIDASF